MPVPINELTDELFVSPLYTRLTDRQTDDGRTHELPTATEYVALYIENQLRPGKQRKVWFIPFADNQLYSPTNVVNKADCRHREQQGKNKSRLCIVASSILFDSGELTTDLFITNENNMLSEYFNLGRNISFLL